MNNTNLMTIAEYLKRDGRTLMEIAHAVLLATRTPQRSANTAARLSRTESAVTLPVNSAGCWPDLTEIRDDDGRKKSSSSAVQQASCLPGQPTVITSAFLKSPCHRITGSLLSR